MKIRAAVIAGLVVVAVIVGWFAMRGSIPEGFDVPFGFSDESFEQGGVPSDVSGELAASAGATAQRFSVSWATVQCCTPSEFDWSTYDAVVAGMRAHGLEPLPMFVGSPGWAREPGCVSSLCPPARGHLEDFGRFAAAAVERWHRPEQGTPLVAAQIWNEPNSSGFWPTREGPNAAAYAKLFTATAQAIDKVDDELPLVVAGLDGRFPVSQPPTYVSIPDFLAMLLDDLPASMLDEQDLLAAHAYSSRFDAIMAETRSVRDSDSPGRRIIVTETGASSELPAADEHRQASELSTVLNRLATADDIAGIFVYTLIEPQTAEGPGQGLGVVGSVAAGYEPKLAYCVVADRAGVDAPEGCDG